MTNDEIRLKIIEVKPCPFCGKLPIPGIDVFIWCDNPDCFMTNQDEQGIFLPEISKWNTRPIEDMLLTEIEQLKLLLETKGVYFVDGKLVDSSTKGR